MTATVQGSTTIYYHSDHLSVRVTSNNSGSKIGEQGHYPYGETWYATGTNTKFIFTSYERDSESGNDYAMARYYINRFARFCSADPLMGSPDDPQSWNRYAYVRNDPVDMVDPTGRSFLSWLAKVFELIPEILLGLPHGIGLGGTPPIIDNGPLSDSAALWSSLYNPPSLSKFATPTFLGSGSSAINLEAWVKAVGECTQKDFGVEMKSFDPSRGKDMYGHGHNGKFVGWGADILSNGGNNATITVVNNVNRFSVSDLDEITGGWNTNGWTPQNKRYWPPGGHWYGEKMGPYENFTANNTQDDYLMVQTHELGHSLADITDVMVPFKGLPMRSDQDTGAWFVNCVEDAYHPPSQ